jgi:predicted transcriptional regulator
VCVEEYSSAITAELFGISEARVSHILKSLRAKTDKALVIDKAWDRYQDDKEYSKLEIDWITI